MIKTKYINYYRLDKSNDFEETGYIEEVPINVKVTYNTKDYKTIKKEYMSGFYKTLMIYTLIFLTIACVCIPIYILSNPIDSVVAITIFGISAFAFFLATLIVWVDGARYDYQGYLTYILLQTEDGKMLEENNRQTEKECRQKKEELKKEEEQRKLDWATKVLEEKSAKDLVEMLDHYHEK